MQGASSALLMGDTASNVARGAVEQGQPPAAKKAEASSAASGLEQASAVVFVLCVASTAWALCWHGGALNFSTCYAHAEDVAMYRTAVLMLMPAMFLEGSRMILAKRSGDDFHIPLEMTEFTIKFITYLAMWLFKGFVVHLNQRSPVHSAVYTLRWLDWAFCVPCLSGGSLSMLESDMAPLTMRRLAPALANCFSFVLTGWACQITPDPTAGVALTALCTLAWIMYVVEQVLIVQEWQQVAHHSRFKVGYLVIMNILFVFYGFVMLFDNFGVMTTLHIQAFYTYGDVLLKSLHAGVRGTIKSWDEQLIREGLSSRIVSVEEDLAKMIESASAPIVCLNQQGVVVGWNAQISQLTRISEEEAKGKYLSALTHAKCRSMLKAALEACSARQNHGAVELTFRASESEAELDAHMTISFAKLGTNESGIVGIGQDMTKLIASQQMLELRMRVTATVSHELKSPLHGITGISKSLAEGAKNVQVKKQLTMIYWCGQRLLDLVANIMDQASLEKTQGQLTTKKLPVNMLDIADEVISLSNAAMDKSGRPLLREGVELRNDMTMDKAPVVLGDPHKCMQLIYNLVTNACKFTKKGHIAVSVRFFPGRLEVDVSDTGCGISPEALKRIFKPYEQESSCARSDVSRTFQGIGLGLSVAKGIAEMHGGTIRVQSELGIGSTFTVSLPCEKEECDRTWAAEPKVGSKLEKRLQHPGIISHPAALPSLPELPNIINTGSFGTLEQLPDHRTCSSNPSLDKLPHCYGDPSNCSSLEQLPLPEGAGVPEISTDEPNSVADLLRQLQWASANPLRPDEKPVVLSVDDDDVNHIVLSNSLSEQYHIEKAMDGHEALDYLRSGKRPPCVVLLDLMMPGMNGWEVVREIREELMLGHLVLPVVMLSARSPQDETAHKSLTSGATDFMAKPFSVPVLEEKMKALLDTRQQGLVLYQRVAQCQVSAAPPGQAASQVAQAQLASAWEEVSRLRAEMTRVRDESEAKVKQACQENAKSAALMDLQRAQDVQWEVEGKKELALARQEVLDLKSEVSRARDEVDEKIAAVKSQMQEEAITEADLLAKRHAQMHQELQEELANARRQVLRLQAEVDRATQEAEERKVTEESSQALQAQENELLVARQEVERLQGELARARDDADSIAQRAKREAQEEATAKLDLRREQAEHLQRELHASRAEVLALQAKAAKADEAVTCSTFRRLSSEASDGSAFGCGSAFAEREVAWLRRELQSARGELVELLQKLETCNTKAHVHQSRADVSEREVAFLRDELSRLRKLLEFTTGM